MQARFLLGPAGSGKTFRCLSEIRSALTAAPDGLPLILIAPKQATFQLERQLLADASLPGYARLQIFSFERLAQFVLDELGVAPPKFLADDGRVMVLRALLLRHADELQLFRQSARRPGFAHELGRLLNELQQHQITPAKLRALAMRNDLSRELSAKLGDLALLAEKYADWLRDHTLQDGNHLLEFATSILSRTQIPDARIQIQHLWLDGFAEMTPQELDLLAVFLPRCQRATLAFCLAESGVQAGENSWLSIWSAVGKTFQQCRQRLQALPGSKIEVEILKRAPGKNRFAENSPLGDLEAAWSGTMPAERRAPTQAESERAESLLGASIRVAACANPDAEAVFAARAILKFVRDGNRFRDCAVLVRNLDAYHQPLARAFQRYEIPFFLDRRESVAHHPLAELTRGALRTIAFDWRMDDWFAALKAGFAPVSEEALDTLENAALEFGWRGEKWREPLPDEKSEALRKLISPPFGNLYAALSQCDFQPTGEQLAAALHKLWDDANVEATLERWTLDEEKSAIGNRQSTIHQTVRNQMTAWLDNLSLAFADELMPLRDWLPVLEAGLANLTVGVVPPALDQVLVGAIDRARNPDLKLALVLGMNETVFPATPVGQTILTDSDRDELARTASLGPDLRERLARERYYGYIACTRASEKLIISYARHTAEGKALNPSPFIAQVKKFFPQLELEEISDEINWRAVEHANELSPMLVGVHALNCPEESLRGELQKIPALRSLAEKLDALREPSETENLTPAFAQKLYGPMLRSSVSRLEEFAQCPFRFFMRAGLRAGERKLFELDARERGNFQHEVLKIFHEQLLAEDKRWRDLTPAEARARIGQIAAAQMDYFRDGLFRDSAETAFAAGTLTQALQDFVAVNIGWLRAQNEFDPAAAELGFGGPEDLAPALEIKLVGGQKLALQGRVDRVDLWHAPGGEAFAVVMDYKSSSKKLNRLLVANGVQLQLLAYLAALRSWNDSVRSGELKSSLFQKQVGLDAGASSGLKLIPAGAFYVNLRGDYQGGGTRAEILADAEESRRTAYRHTGRFDAGMLDQLDRTGAADQFNYRRNQNGSLRKGSAEALPRVEFDDLLDGVERQLRALGERIFSGEAQVDPYRKGKQTPCEYCDYQAACRIDKWTHPYRTLRAAPESLG